MASQTAETNNTGDLEELTYETARAQLVATIQTLESGDGTLEESLAAWERGEALADRCQALLDNARERLAAAEGGSDQVEP